MKKTTANPAYDRAFEYREKGSADSAFLYFNKAKEVFLQEGDSLGTGKCLLNMAIISTDKGDYFGGQELSLAAIAYFSPWDSTQHVFIRSNYNNLGIATYKLKDYPNALRFYDDAIKFSNDSLDTRVYLNNKAKTYQDMKDYGRALEVYREVLSGTSRNQREYARTLSNIARATWQRDPAAPVLGNFLRALEIRRREKDLWGLNASYSHLSDYYAENSPRIALSYADSMYRVARQLGSGDDKLQALRKLIRLSSPGSSQPYFHAYERLDDSLQSARSQAKNQFALIRYESEKNKADKLLLQKENTAKNYQMGAIAFVALVILSLGLAEYKRRRRKLAQATEKRIRDSELKTSKHVHDVVANGLYRMMKEIQNRIHTSAESLLDKIEQLYEKSRDISYNRPVIPEQAFDVHIRELLGSFPGEQTRLIIVGNGPDIWSGATADVLYEIEQVLQELMINMTRHSGADHVVFRFERSDRMVNITYRDNGKGIEEGTAHGNGLRSTGNRIKSISGSIIFGTVPGEQGLKIQISFPV
ncbi:tetratricopeptide repeat-containing sensor histidine kinase [Pedobacter sp. 22226]|uniref:tetratricopeptide repeat-containing sensor histidine kinase n=1 Tax=Pedobacter sp. 22226 TaxID=3453894 RepID=UPI003F85C565